MAVRCPKCHTDNPDALKYCGECGTRLPDAGHVQVTKTVETPKEELTTGSTFAGRYQIIEELGRGGMGRVYKANDTEIKEKVALKLIKPEIATDERTIERFQNELRFARKIRHRNVCQMYDLNRDKGTSYITMEYVEGENLKDMIRMSGQLGVGTAVSVAKQVCEGLEEAHKLGVIHRDLKPGNIMIDRDGRVRIMDFGIARSLRDKGITGAGVMIGTPEYMSPEQVEGKETDQRSDIYSLGIILYEMVTGKVPFEGDTALAVGMKHKGETPRPPRQLNAQVPDELDRAILRCLEKDKEKRYQSAGELLADLANIEKGLPTTARVVRERKPLTSREITVTLGVRKLIVPAVVLVAVVLVGLLVWHPWSKNGAVPLPPSDKPSLAVMYFENNTGDESLDHWRKGISDLLITDLTQSKHLKVLGGDRLFDILGQMGQLGARSYSSDVLRGVASQGGVNHIARGSYTKAGDILRIDMVVQNAETGEPVATRRVEGKGEEAIFAMVDELTTWTKESLRLSAQQIAGDLDRRIASATTSSPEAFKFYAEGHELFREREFQQSIESLEKAIALDPGFAMAYRKMGVACGNIGKRDEQIKYLKKALELSDRLTDRERLVIQGSYFGSSEPTYGQAIEAYEELVSLYPESGEAVTAHINLGILYSATENLDKAIEHTDAGIRSDNDFRSSYTNQASYHMTKGDYSKAQKILADTISRYPDYVDAHWILARVYAFQGRFDQALAEVDRTAAIAPTYTKAQFYHMMWDFEKAEEGYKKWLDQVSPSTHLQARERLSYLYRTLGKFDEAKDQILLGIKAAESQKNDGYLDVFNYQLAYLNLVAGNQDEAREAVKKIGITDSLEMTNRFYDLELRGWILAEMREWDKARKTAEEIKGLVDAGPFKKRIRHYEFVRGVIDLKTKKYAGAIESFKKAVSLLPHPVGFITDDGLYRYFLAMAYQESGDLRMAREEFEGLVGFIPGRNTYGDLYAESYYKLGQIYERLGDRAKAVANYERFLDLWKDADPGLPEVERARTSLSKLRT
ncbi:MAG TPA: tetratricopeptide repeat protein [Candidatus Aminicenantes bacterium]|nr:tetratricopeptide repeat protein [Candidatus Aminicenantes bacterium]